MPMGSLIEELQRREAAGRRDDVGRRIRNLVGP
jgi:hypothetical protein